MRSISIVFCVILSLIIGLMNAQPSNDDCSNAILLTPSTACNSITGDVSNATQSLPGCSGTANDDVWYYFIADSSSMIMEASGSQGFDMVLELFDGCNGNSLFCSDDSLYIGTVERITANSLIIGNSYYIRAYDYGGGTPVNTTFNICLKYGVIPPTNDSCINAQLISANTNCIYTSGDVSGATQSLPGCAGNANDDVWYKFTATDTSAIIYVDPSLSFDPVIELFDGCNGNPIECKDDDGNGGAETISSSNLIIGNEYYIRVYDYKPTFPTTTTFNICVSTMNLVSPPSNDTCGGAEELIVNSSCIATSGDVSNATESMPGCSGSAGEDVWYKFTATASDLIIDVIPSSGLDPVIELFDGCNGNSLACRDLYFAGIQESINASGLTIGNEYFLRVYDYDTIIPITTTFDICIHEPIVIPLNDDCSSAELLTVNNTCISTTGSVANATESLAGCSGEANEDVWYTFVAASSNTTIHLDCPTDFDGVIELFDGCNGNSLFCEDAYWSGYAESINATNLTIGNTYYFRVYEYSDSVPPNTFFDICVYNTILPPANDDCSGAITLTVASSDCANPIVGNVNAATESLSGCSGNANDDVWYSFTATQTNMQITAIPSDSMDIVIEVQSGCTSPTLQCKDLGYMGESENLSLNSLTIGNTYYVRIYDYEMGYPATTTFTVCLNNAPIAPVNDNCNNATSISIYNNESSCNPTLVTTNNSTKSQPLLTCDPISTDDDVWYRFNATHTSVTFKASNLNFIFGVGFALYSDSCNGSLNSTCTGNAAGDSITFNQLVLGKTYYLRTFSYGIGTYGSYNLCGYAHQTTTTNIENEKTSDLHFYPNPAADKLYIKLESSEEAIISILNGEGKLVYTKSHLNTSNKSMEIDLSQFNDGIYFLQKTDSKNSMLYKFIISK